MYTLGVLQSSSLPSGYGLTPSHHKNKSEHTRCVISLRIVECLNSQQSQRFLSDFLLETMARTHFCLRGRPQVRPGNQNNPKHLDVSPVPSTSFVKDLKNTILEQPFVRGWDWVSRMWRTMFCRILWPSFHCAVPCAFAPQGSFDGHIRASRCHLRFISVQCLGVCSGWLGGGIE